MITVCICAIFDCDTTSKLNVAMVVRMITSATGPAPVSARMLPTITGLNNTYGSSNERRRMYTAMLFTEP